MNPIGRPSRLAFVLDQQVGLKTQALNLVETARLDPEIDLTTVAVDYAADAGWLARLPLLPGGARGTLRGVKEIRDGLGDARQFDAILWATWAAKSVPDLVEAAPAFFRMDMTPGQMEDMGAWYGYSRRRAQFLGGLKTRATRRIYNRAAHFLPWNDWVAESLRNDWSVAADKITPISPGVDTRRFTPSPTPRDTDTSVRVLFVGGDFLRKGGDLLLKWRQQLPDNSPVELHVVTRDYPGTPLPGVVFHGPQDNNSDALVRLYQQADIFALPTRADCYSLVALEAMACGLPVVISHLGGISDIVGDNATGFLIPPDDFPALSDRLNRLVADTDLRERLGDAGRARACERFDSRNGVGQLLQIMKTKARAAR